MSLIEKTFRDLREKNEAALIGYLTVGIPNPNKTSLVAEALIRGGVDILELGIPFSDPIADGPTIQAASHQALNLGVTPKSVFTTVEQIKSRYNLPIVLLTYFNPIYRMGINKFLETGKAHGVDGLVVPDLPVEESGKYCNFAEKHGIDTIFLASPATSVERLHKIVNATSGFLYLVSL
jgi:tryptophan synthase alpha chain